MKSKMSYHGCLDRIGASIGSFVYRKSRFFGASLKTESIRTAIDAMRVEITDFQSGLWHDVIAYGSDNQFKTGYYVYNWEGFHAPTLLYIHGSGEHPKDFSRFSDNSFRKIFTQDNGRLNPPMNVILLIAPFHEGTQQAYIEALGHLSNYIGMLAATTVLLNELASRLVQQGCPAVYAAGFSLGGWVVNLHRAYFGKYIKRYIPICAGTRPEAVFLRSQYNKLTAESALNNPTILREKLNFEADFQANKALDCFPLLFRYDQLIELEEQLPGYHALDVQIIEKGHFTGQQAIDQLRNHIFNALA